MKGAIEIRQAEYDKAKQSLAAASTSEAVTFDKGLAHLVSENYVSADTYFGEIADSKVLGAEANYYRAVTAARRNAPEDVTKYLVEAVKLDASLKDKALNDLEFSDYANQVSEALK